MKTQQQIKSLECETSFINLKELAENKNSEVTDRKSELQENCKGFVVLDVYQLFPVLYN